MKKKVVKSQYGVWITVYEVEHEGRILWFDEKAIESAAHRYAIRRDEDEDEMAWLLESGDG